MWWSPPTPDFNVIFGGLSYGHAFVWQVGDASQNFVQAHLQKAKILAKEGDFSAAQSELKAYGKSKKDAEAEELVCRIGEMSRRRNTN